MLRILITVLLITGIVSCGAESKKTIYNYTDGEGPHTYESLSIPDTINQDMVFQGEMIVGQRCTACHRIAKEKLIGPGLYGVTKRRSPQWIMNFVTNPAPMIDKDTSLQDLVELCLVEMPDLGLTEQEARNILEFLRSVDSKTF